MKISPYAIEEFVNYLTDCGFLASKNGRELISIFNKFGVRDIYDETGLPDIGKRNGQRPSKKEYLKARINDFNGKFELRDILTQIINELDSKLAHVESLNEIFQPERFDIAETEGELILIGGTIIRRKSVVNEAHFQDIQNRIVTALDSARVSIRLVIAWFTNDILFNKLIEKHKAGIDVQIAIYDDGINRKHGVDINQLPNVKIKRGKRGGLMHDKFCVIDNQGVITGSYNWTSNAEFKNDENITVDNDPDQATRYSEEYRRLTT